jgi:hypothetical protein
MSVPLLEPPLRRSRPPCCHPDAFATVGVDKRVQVVEPGRTSRNRERGLVVGRLRSRIVRRVVDASGSVQAARRPTGHSRTRYHTAIKSYGGGAPRRDQFRSWTASPRRATVADGDARHLRRQPR